MPYKEKLTTSCPNVDYFAPVQRVLDVQNELEKRKNRKRTRTCDTAYLADVESDSENLCLKPKKKRRSLREYRKHSKHTDTPGIREVDFMRSFGNDTTDRVVDDTVLQTSTMLSYDNTQQYKVPNPDADDYLESLQKRWWC